MQIKKLLVLVVFIFALGMLQGCANAGNSSIENLSEEQAGSMIRKGVTTKDQVRQMFGSPFETTYTDGGLEIWKYQFDDTSALTAETVGSFVLTFGLAGMKARGTRNELVVLFDENNLVKQFSMSNSPIEAGTGIF